MTPQSEFHTVTRRPLDVEDYVDILRRNKGMMFGPAFIGLVGAFIFAFTQPDIYVSEAVIRIIPPQISGTLVPSAVVLGLSQRVNAMAQSVLSRSNLTNLVLTNNLYPRQRKKEPIEDIVERMRTQIGIGSVQNIASSQNGDVAAFRLTYRYENRQLAQRICGELVQKFMGENIGERNKAADSAQSFFTEQQRTAKEKLDAAESALTKFRVEHQGALPEEANVNSTQLNSLNQQLDSTQMAINRSNQEKLVLESNLQSLKDHRNSLQPPTEETTTTTQKSERLAQLDRDIETYELRLAALKEKYKESHPDVQTVASELNVLRKTRENVAKSEPAAKTVTVASPLNRQLQANYERDKKAAEAEIRRTETLIRTREMDMEQLRQEVARIQSDIHKTEARLGSLPIGLEEYSRLARERDLARQNYQEISQKTQSTVLFRNLEKMQQGEQLEVLDQPSLPMTPAEPNRWTLIGAGMGIGLAVGIALTVVKELKDTSMRTLKDVRAYTQLNVLGSVPLLENELTIRRRRRFRFLAWSTVILIGCFAMSGSFYYYWTMRT